MMQRMTADQFRKSKKPKRGNKYSAESVTVRGQRFDSKREARRWLALRAMERAGEIRDLRRQVAIELEGRDGPMLTRTGRKMRLTVDFTYVDAATGLLVYEDAKGAPTQDYEVRRAAAGAMGIDIKET